tara:strand:- start:209739 stop:211571 length:1833 start_codon:yes stop_codon:yes gene_type:complete
MNPLNPLSPRTKKPIKLRKYLILSALYFTAAMILIWFLVMRPIGHFGPPLTQAQLKQVTPDWSIVTHNNWSPWYTDPNAGPDGPTDNKPVWNPAASYNAWLETVPEEDKAWPGLTWNMERYKRHEYDLYQTDHLRNNEFGTLPNEPAEWSRIEPTLASPISDELLEGLKRDLAKPVLACVLSTTYGPAAHAAIVEFDNDFDPGPLEYDPKANLALANVFLPSVGDLSRMTNFLKSKGAHELEQANPDTFVEIVELLFNSAHHAAALPALIGQLVEFSIQDKAMELMSWGIEHHRDQLTEEHLRTFEQLLAQPNNFKVRWQGEAMVFHDSIRRLTNKYGVLDNPTPAQTNSFQFELADPISTPDDQLDPSMQRVLMVYNQILQTIEPASTLPWDQDATTAQEILDEHDWELAEQAKRHLKLFVPALDSITGDFRARSQRALGLRTAIAAHRHRLRHGQFPSAIESIQIHDPDLMPFDPIDAFTNQPLRYEILGPNLGQGDPDDPNTMPVIYSLGHDRTDNAATPAYSVVMMDKLVINETTGEKEIIEVEVRTVLPPEWTTGPKEYAQGLTPPKERWGDWILFPIPMDDPAPRDFDYNDLTGEYEWIEDTDW